MKSSYSAVLNELDSDWVLSECSKANFGDKRLNARLTSLLSSMSAQPNSPINQSCPNLSETLAAYRFIDNDKVSPDEILESHIKQSLSRGTKEDVVLCIQDTSFLKLNNHKACEELGYIGRETLKGLMVHSVFAVLPSGLPLGVLGIDFHTREEITRRTSQELRAQPIEKKESGRWLKSAKKVKGLFEKDTEVVHVCDREADIFEFYQCIEAQNDFFLVRSRKDRRTEEGDNLYELLEEEKALATVQFEVPSRGGRPKRKATLEIRFTSAGLPVPHLKGSKSRRDLKPIEMWCVEAKEVDPPDGVEAIRWRLITNMAVESLEEALEKILWYSRRWAIEEMHKILKSCCRVEKAQFQSVKRLSNYITLRSIIAWRIYYLVHINRVDPDASAYTVLTASEVQTLELLLNEERMKEGKKRQIKIKTARQALTEIAKLGGFLDRKNDHYPGITVIWRGIMALSFSTRTFVAMQKRTYV